MALQVSGFLTNVIPQDQMVDNSSKCIDLSNPLALGSGYSQGIHIAIVSLHGITILIAVVLNSLICHVYRKKHVRQTPFNALLVNLAVGDIVTALGMLPFVIVSPIFLRSVPAKVADLLCTVTVGQFIFWMGNSVSIMALSVISVNRYAIINHPLSVWSQQLRSKKAIMGMIAFPWLMGIVLPLPNLFSRTFKPCIAICPRQWPKEIDSVAYAIGVTIIGYFIPILIMFYTLFASIRTLWYKDVPPGTNLGVQKARKRVIVLLCTLMFTFFFWWTPFAVYWIASRVTSLFPEGDAGYYKRARVIYVATLAALVNAAVNPIVYGLKSSDFRRAVREQLNINMRNFSSSMSAPLIPGYDADA